MGTHWPTLDAWKRVLVMIDSGHGVKLVVVLWKVLTVNGVGYLAGMSVVSQKLGWSNILVVAPGNGSAGSGARHGGPIERTQRMQGTQRTHQRLVIVTARLTASLSTVVVAVVVIAVAFIVVDVLVLRLRLILAHIEALLVENVNHIQSIRLTHCSSLRLGFVILVQNGFCLGLLKGRRRRRRRRRSNTTSSDDATCQLKSTTQRRVAIVDVAAPAPFSFSLFL